MTTLGNPNLEMDDDLDEDAEAGLSPDGEEFSSSYESEFGADPSTSMFYHLSIREAFTFPIVDGNRPPPGEKRHSNSVPVFFPASGTFTSCNNVGMFCMPVFNSTSHRESFRRVLRNCLDKIYMLMARTKRRPTFDC